MTRLIGHGWNREEAEALADFELLERYFEAELGLEPGDFEITLVSSDTSPVVHEIFHPLDAAHCCWEGVYGRMVNTLKKRGQLDKMRDLLKVPGWSKIAMELLKASVKE